MAQMDVVGKEGPSEVIHDNFSSSPTGPDQNSWSPGNAPGETHVESHSEVGKAPQGVYYMAVSSFACQLQHPLNRTRYDTCTMCGFDPTEHVYARRPHSCGECVNAGI